MQFLRQSTAATVIAGGFTDKADGFTPLTALADQSANARLVKAGTGAAFTANSWAHDGNGHYKVGFTTSHTDTVGPLRLDFALASTYLPVWEDFTVLAAVQYDALIANTDNFDVSVTQWTGTNVASPNTAGVPQVDLTLIDGAATAGNNATLNLKQLNVVNSAGDAIVATSSGSNGKGINATGNGSGAGILSTGGATGDGIKAAGGATSGSGISAVGTGAGHGIAATAGATGDGLKAVTTAGVPIRGNITGNITGNLSGSVGSVSGAVGSVTGAVGSVTGAVGSVSGNVGGNVVGSVASVVGAVGSVTGLTASNLDTTVSSRLATASYTTPPTAAVNADAVWDELLSGHVIAGSAGEALGDLDAGLVGSKAITLRVVDGAASRISDVQLSLYDATQTNLLARGTTNASGEMGPLGLDAGTYKLVCVKGGYTFTTPETLTVTVDATLTITGAAFVSSPASSPSLCVVYGTLLDAGGNARVGVVVRVRSSVPQHITGNQLSNEQVSATTNASGYFEVELVRSSQVHMHIPGVFDATKTVPDAASQNIASW